MRAHHPKSILTASSSLERYGIPNLNNACLILKLLANADGKMKAADIARALHIPVTTNAVGALGITAATVRFTRARIPEMVAAHELSQLLGHPGN